MYYIIHFSYCITVFLNVLYNTFILLYNMTVFVNVLYNTYSGKLFTIQKHCMIILSGNKEAYLDKFKTSCRTRPIEIQVYLFQIE